MTGQRITLGRLWRFGPLAEGADALESWSKGENGKLEPFDDVVRRCIGLYDTLFALSLAFGPAALVASVSTASWLELLVLYVGGLGLIFGAAWLRPLGSDLMLMPAVYHRRVDEARRRRANAGLPEMLGRATAEERSPDQDIQALYAVAPQDRLEAARDSAREVLSSGASRWGRARRSLVAGLVLCMLATVIHLSVFFFPEASPVQQPEEKKPAVLVTGTRPPSGDQQQGESEEPPPPATEAEPASPPPEMVTPPVDAEPH